MKPDNNSRKRQNHDNQQHRRKPTNTSVYVTNLPSDVTVEELAEVFSKYGVLMEDFVNGMFWYKMTRGQEKRKRFMNLHVKRTLPD